MAEIKASVSNMCGMGIGQKTFNYLSGHFFLILINSINGKKLPTGLLLNASFHDVTIFTPHAIFRF